MSELTLEERDRRWSQVAAAARDAGMDAVLVPLGNGVDARYLTQMRASIVVLPTDGRAPIVVTDRRQTNTWVPSPRHTVREWTGPTTAALRDVGLVDARIGVSGLRSGTWTHVSAANGVAVHAPLSAARAALPDATFVDATDVLGDVRSVKSAEEVDCLGQAASIAEAGLDALVEAARGGAQETVVRAAAVQRVLALGSAYRPHTFTVDGQPSPVPGRVLRPGSVLTAHIVGFHKGYLCTETQSYVIGGGDDAGLQRVSEAQQAAFEAVLPKVVPGSSFVELERSMSEVEDGDAPTVRLHICGIGLGDDGPVLSDQTHTDDLVDVRLRQGNTLRLELSTRDDLGRTVSWGTGVVVTATGGERLSRRQCEVIVGKP